MTIENRQQYSLAVGESDLERMTMLGEIYMPYCTDFLLENGLVAGMSVADIGCGPGNASLWLADKVGKTGRIVAIDNSEAQLAILNNRIIEQNIYNINTKNIDIYELDQINEQFDMVFCRFLLVHLSNPIQAIQQMSKLVKPGGCLILAELDNSTWFSYPEHWALIEDTKMLCQVGIKKETDFCIGPKLYEYVHQQNFDSINVKIDQPVLTDEKRQYLLLKSQAWSKTYLENNLVSEENLQNLIKSLHGLVDNSDYLLAGAKMYLVSGRK